MIIIADDNPTDRLILRSILESMGHVVSIFDNGIEAYNAIYTSNEPTISILDWHMPEMDGVTICHKLFNDPPKHPFYNIIITGKTLEENINKALEMGANDYIEKPIKPLELKARINAGLRMLSIAELQLKSNARLLDYTTRIEEIAQERAQQLVHAERLSSLGILSAGLAHEINNPVSFISVNIDTLEENCVILKNALNNKNMSPEEIRRAELFINTIPEILAEMKSGIGRIREIINGLKTYVHKNNSNKTTFYINDCIDSAISLCQNKLKDKVSLNLKLDKNFPIFGSANEIEQIIINLLINATDAIESFKENGNISISTFKNDNNVIIEITDDGPGIPKDKIENIFTPFFTTKEVGKGTGLGLSISQNIIKSYNGSLLAENNEFAGAKFTIILPIKSRRL